MKVIKMRDGSAIFIDKEVNLEAILGSQKKFVKVGDMIINRADITAVVSKDQYDTMLKMSNGMVLTSQGWMSRKEYTNNGFLRVQTPEELLISDPSRLLEN